MDRIVGVTDLVRSFSKFLDLVVRGRGETLILTRDSRPEAALISYAELQRLRAAAERQWPEQFTAVLTELARANREYSLTEVQADVEAVVAEVRRKHRA
jgi:antitoxin (DNA-binding transcriptional repressor) of toxin-antitoxin stability system